MQNRELADLRREIELLKKKEKRKKRKLAIIRSTVDSDDSSDNISANVDVEPTI